jgi:predicted alpha/beta hydrolase family esterase
MSAQHGKHQRPLVLFVHGVGGNKKSTWGDFSTLIENDTTLKGRVDWAFFGYPTAIWRIPYFDPIAVRIEDVALAIQSEVASRYKDYSDIVLIYHSMGCTVARTYLIETLKAKKPLKIRGVLFFAEPEFGSELARWADYFSIQHWQMRQLRKGSDLLERIKTDWKTFVSGGSFKICEVKGGQDGVLPRTEHPPDLFFLADKDHRTIVKPLAHDDGSYVIFRNFVMDALNLSGHDRRTACLFDVYQPSSNHIT